MLEAETESIVSDEEVDVESEADVAPAAMIRRSAHIQEGFISLDMVNVREVITIRSCVMKVLPAFLRGAYRSAMRLALQEIVSAMGLQNRLIPRMLLFRQARGGKVPKNQLSENAARLRSRRRRNRVDDVEKC